MHYIPPTVKLGRVEFRSVIRAHAIEKPADSGM